MLLLSSFPFLLCTSYYASEVTRDSPGTSWPFLCISFPVLSCNQGADKSPEIVSYKANAGLPGGLVYPTPHKSPILPNGRARNLLLLQGPGSLNSSGSSFSVAKPETWASLLLPPAPSLSQAEVTVIIRWDIVALGAFFKCFTRLVLFHPRYSLRG